MNNQWSLECSNKEEEKERERERERKRERERERKNNEIQAILSKKKDVKKRIKN